MRKDAGFEVMDKITVYVDGNDKLADLMVKNAEQIRALFLQMLLKQVRHQDSLRIGISMVRRLCLRLRRTNMFV